jgi:hypothetical protein
VNNIEWEVVGFDRGFDPSAINDGKAAARLGESIAKFISEIPAKYRDEVFRSGEIEDDDIFDVGFFDEGGEIGRFVRMYGR